MSIEALNWVKRMHRTRIKPSPRSVLRELADFADEAGECWPSVETLSNCTSLSERAVQEALRALEQQGLIVTFRRSQTSSRYRLIMSIDLSRPLEGAPSAPTNPRRHRVQKTPVFISDVCDNLHTNTLEGAPSAPTTTNSEGAPFATSRVQISSFEGAAAAPEPPENHHRTTRGRGARASARPTPLPPDWQPGERGEVYARRLGLDPAPLALRFRKTFLASGKRLADWDARWELWCDEDAGERGISAATSAAPAPSGAALEGLDARAVAFVRSWQAKQAAGDSTAFSEQLMADRCPEALAYVRAAGNVPARSVSA